MLSVQFLLKIGSFSGVLKGDGVVLAVVAVAVSIATVSLSVVAPSVSIAGQIPSLTGGSYFRLVVRAKYSLCTVLAYMALALQVIPTSLTCSGMQKAFSAADLE